MHLVSIQVGRPREVEWRGKRVATAIFKEPVEGPVRLERLNLEGDRQADLSVHGGEDKAVYAYPSEHYDFWGAELAAELVRGNFGENLTTAGLSETDLHVGDRLRIGTAELEVTEPRLPCFKLGLRFGRPEIVRLFLASRRSGFYLRVRSEGVLQTGDAIEIVHRDPRALSIADFLRVYAFDKRDRATLERALAVEALPESWREHFTEQLAKITD